MKLRIGLVIGRCCIADEIGERDDKTMRPKAWKCSSDCKTITDDERRTIGAIAFVFKQNVGILGRGLEHLDDNCDNYKYTCSALLLVYRDDL